MPEKNPGNPARPQRALWHVDRPAYRPAADVFDMEGWVAANEEVAALIPQCGSFSSFAWKERADLVPPPGGLAWARGFRARASVAVLEGNVFTCQLAFATDQHELQWTFPELIDPQRKARKLDRLPPLFRDDVTSRRTRDYYNFLPPDMPVAEPELISSYHYPEVVNEAIRRHADG